ncbi:unnamed protein product [Clonostachys rhizophaga]|uniref:Uncharacterized protein n=1 Tax=Clonostachys rhizophaga TaxID=160324 RepID=A0A9N9VB40_9HYPO|nr:unnamed protein product [Clonostachys rhizophaga]
MTSSASKCGPAALQQRSRIDFQTVVQDNHQIRFIKYTQGLLSLPLDGSHLTLIQVAWQFKESLTQPRPTTPSRLPAILTNCRAGKLDDSTPEARFYEQGGSRAVDAFCAALREVPQIEVAAHKADRKAYIEQYGGRHAVQAFHAIESLHGSDDVDKAKALIRDYGGTQALAFYAAAKTSSPKSITLIKDFSEGDIDTLLDCISEVELHRDLFYIIETLIRTQKPPQWKTDKTHIGRASHSTRGGTRQQKRELSKLRRRQNRPSLTTRHGTQNLSHHADFTQATQMPNTSNQMNIAETTPNRNEASQMNVLPVHQSGQDEAVSFVDFTETNLSALLATDFHFSGALE